MNDEIDWQGALPDIAVNEPNNPDPVEPNEEIEGLDLDDKGTWGEYPLDELLIRNDHRTVNDVLRRIEQGRYVMNPDFQRDFIWSEDKQSKLIESVVMRIPLPVFYTAEDHEGRMIVVDGLQRLSTFRRFVNNDFKLRLEDREELNGKKFSELSPRFQNRIEDCNLIFYIIDSKAPERARLDIFERVNGGVPLTRQQMRNCLFTGSSTNFLKTEAASDIFLNATGRSLNTKIMRDREFVNRFCAFTVLGVKSYRGDMDLFLANCLSMMNKMTDSDLKNLSILHRRGLTNNFHVFGPHAFRKISKFKNRRSVINASLWDVMSTGLSRYPENTVKSLTYQVRSAVERLLEDEEFNTSITYATNGTARVQGRFKLADDTLEEIFGANPN